MAIAFNKASGKAIKNGVKHYTYVNGDNRVRMFGGILARYVYWITGTNGKAIPFECLSFDREAEAFTNKEKDWVKEYYPDMKCSWSYCIQCIDPTDGTVKVLNLKKKLLEQIMTAAEDLGDPTDPDTGWSICFKRVKTGSMAYNVEYQFQPLKCKPEPLTDEEKALIAEAPSIDEILPRPSAEAQKILLDTIRNQEATDETMDETIEDEFDIK